MKAIHPHSFISRTAAIIHGVVSRTLYIAAILYAAGFIGNFLVPMTTDSMPADPPGIALAINAGLLGMFALHHSTVARTAVKRRLTRLIHAAAERSTFVLLASLTLILLFWRWRPVGGVIWQIKKPLGEALMRGGFEFGVLLMLATAFLIDHIDLFGLRQGSFLRHHRFERL